MTEWRAPQLPCGAELADLLEQVSEDRADQRTEHQRSCQFCQAALDEADHSWGPLRSLASEEIAVPDGLVESILRRVRRLSQAGWLTVERTGRGVTRASAWVVAAIAEAAADDVDGVHRVGTSFGRLLDALREAMPAGKGERTATGGTAYEVGDNEVAVEIDVVVDYGTPIPDIAALIRRDVRAEVESLTGLHVREVDIEVTGARFPHPSS